MSETNDDYWEVNRCSPSIELDLGDRQFEMTYFNTTVYTFIGSWAMADHVYIRADIGGTYLFDCQELADKLHEENYPYISQPFPTDGDVLAFRNWQSKRLDAELDALGNDNESPSEGEN